MSKRIGMRVALGVMAAFIAVIAATAIGTAPAQAVVGSGACLVGVAPDTRYVGIDATELVTYLIANPGNDVEDFCRDEERGRFVSKEAQLILAVTFGFFDELPFINPAKEFPDGWFRGPSVCRDLLNGGTLLSTGDLLLLDPGNNRITDVYATKAVEFAVQIVYDIVSNAEVGVTGAIVGAVLGVVRIPVFITEWTYDVQNECQGNATANTIDDINMLLNQFANDFIVHARDTDAALVSLKSQLVANQDQNLRLVIEDHLETCRALASLLLSDSGGLLPLTVLVVDDLADRAELAGLNINNARRHMAQANDSIAAGDVRRGYQSLCKAYNQIVSGR